MASTTSRRAAAPALGLLLAFVAACSVQPVPSEPPDTGSSPGPSASASPATATPDPSSSPDVPPRGGPYELDCPDPSVGEPGLPDPGTVACQLTRFDAQGRVLPGWPVEVAGPCANPTAAPDGTLLVTCGTQDGTEVLAFDAAGQRREGWRALLPGSMARTSWNDFSFGCGREVPALAVGANGVVYAAVGAGDGALLFALGPGGSVRPGWPQPLPGDGTWIGPETGPCVGFALAPDGSIRAWGYQGVTEDPGGIGYFPFATRTVYTAIGADGETLPGWPFGSQRAGSGPIVGAGGVLYHVSEAGNLWGHDVTAQPVAGAPYKLPQPVAPILTSDGRLLLVLDRETGAELLSFPPGSGLASGVTIDLGAARQSLCLGEGDTDCFGSVPPALGPDGTVYLSLGAPAPGEGSRIVALAPNGHSAQGWPVQLPVRTYSQRMSFDLAGNPVVDVLTCDDPQCSSVSFGKMRFSPRGELLEVTREQEP